MFCKPMRHAAAVIPVFSRRRFYAKRTISRSRPIARPPCISRWAVARGPSAMRNIFTIMSGLKDVLRRVSQPNDGALKPDLSRPGNGLELKRKDAKKFAL